jgi:hypothetical protein
VGTTEWNIADVPLFEGPNVITVTAYDTAGNPGPRSQIITYAPDDVTPPTIQIDFPTINSTLITSDSVLNVSGSATDDRGLASIIWENGAGESGTASGSETWFVNDIPLQMGDNLITVTATDAAINVATDTLVVSRIPSQLSISGTISYCSNPSVAPVPNAILTVTGDTLNSTLSDSSGAYQFVSLGSNGNYTVTPTKAALASGSAGINTTDVVAIQRHFLNFAPLPSGCRLTAADVNSDVAVNTVDIVAIQRFFLGQTSGTANVGRYQFTPASRAYNGIATDQSNQNYDALIFGDVTAPFVE